MNGHKIRIVQVSPWMCVGQELVKALGASPTPIPWPKTKMFSSLQSRPYFWNGGLVEGFV